MKRTSTQVPSASRDHLAPHKVALYYGLAGAFWILLTDMLLRFGSWDVDQLSYLQTAKGWVFVLVSALLLYGLLRYYTRAMQRREALLRASEERFRSVFVTGAAGMVLMRPDGGFLQANPAFCRFVGYTEEELVRMTITEVTHPEDRERTKESYEILSSGQESVHYEKRYLTRDGRTVWGHASVACLLGRDNLPDYCIGLVQDITQRKESEEALLVAHQQLQEIIDFLPDATFVIDRERKVVAWNRAIEKMSGVPKEEMVGQGDYAYAIPFYGERRPMLLDLIDSPGREQKENCDIIGNHGECVEKYLPLVYGGKRTYVWATASQLLDREGNFTGAIESMRDISDQKEAREKVEAANRELEAFVYTVSHDLRSPLTPIIGYADFLLESCRGRLSGEELDCLTNIKTSGKKMVELMEDLLNLARVGQIERPSEPLNTREIVSEVVRGLTGQSNHVETVVDIGTLPALRVPRTLLVQIFDNLITNALRYGCQAGERIEVGGERSGARVRLFVRDHGPGIPAGEQARIFEVFYRGSTGKDIKGTGIGLATVQKIAKLYSGRAWVEETPQGGSTFWVEMVDEPMGNSEN